jgi:hypothetical protein
MNPHRIKTLLDRTYPKAGDSKYVKVKNFNDLIEDIEAIVPSTGTIKTDTISEYTSGEGVTIDGVQIMNGFIRHGTAISFTVPYILEAIPEALSGPHAISTSCYFSSITTTDADAFTLAAPTLGGQLKEIQMIADGGDATITVTGGSGFTTIVMGDVGDNVLLMAIESSGSLVWRLVRNLGCTIS